MVDGSEWQMLQARRHPVPNRTEQILLGRAIRAWQDWPDGPEQAPSRIIRAGRRALDRMVTGNLRLVFRFAANHRGAGLEMEDLIQAGSEGLLHAARRFDPARGYAFSTYAAWWIRQSLQKERRHAWAIAVPLEVAALADRAAAVTERLQRGGLNPTLEEIAAELSTAKPVSADRLERSLRVNAECRCRSLDVTLKGSDALSLVDACAAPDPSPLEVVMDEERLERVRRAIDGLREPERDVVLAVDFEGLSYAAAAMSRQPTREGLRRRHLRAKRDLVRALGDLAVCA
jgi:RNA polymerase sigma factor (sigma-70 family)